MSDFKFNIGDIVKYNKRNYRIIGRTEYPYRNRIIAWQPLPETYDEESEDKE